MKLFGHSGLGSLGILGVLEQVDRWLMALF